LRVLGVSIVDRSVDLRRSKITPRSQLRRIELHNHLAFVQTVSFPSEDFLHASTRARSHMRFVHFDRSRNRVVSVTATSKQDKQRENSGCREEESARCADRIPPQRRDGVPTTLRSYLVMRNLKVRYGRSSLN